MAEFNLAKKSNFYNQDYREFIEKLNNLAFQVNRLSSELHNLKTSYIQKEKEFYECKSGFHNFNLISGTILKGKIIDISKFCIMIETERKEYLLIQKSSLEFIE